MKEYISTIIRSSILGISVIIGCFMIGDALRSSSRPMPELPDDLQVRSHVSLTDLNKTTFTLTNGIGIAVILRSGEKRIIRSKDLEAEFFHSAHLLVIRYDYDGKSKYFYAFEPMTWESLTE